MMYFCIKGYVTLYPYNTTSQKVYISLKRNFYRGIIICASYLRSRCEP